LPHQFTRIAALLSGGLRKSFLQLGSEIYFHNTESTRKPHLWQDERTGCPSSEQVDSDHFENLFILCWTRVRVAA
jgi:hypothetical protein